MLDDKKIYDIWYNIIVRCKNEKYPTYLKCDVCKEWEIFNNFKNWYINHYYEVENEKMCVDKDILYKHNKTYSPQTCCIVPETLNMILTNRYRFRGHLPVGVTFKDGKYMSKCKIDSKDKYIGLFDTSTEAFNAYKNVKEKHIKEMAEKFKSKIPINVYNALMNYTVEIND